MTPTIQRLLLIGLAGLIVITLAVAMARLTWHLAGDPGIGAANAAPVSAPASGTMGPRADLSPILALAPFGSAAPLPEAAPQETSLGLVLLGVVVAEPAAASSAVIAVAGGTARAYRIGEAITGGATLESVASYSVTLSVAGRREILSFPKAQTQTPTPYVLPPSPALANGGGTIPQAPAKPASGMATGVKRVDADAIADDFRKRIAANPQTVMNEVGLDATSGGYRLKETMMPELRRAGLKPGDLVVRVNGKAVGNVEQDRSLFDDVVAAGRARVEVMRDGSLIVMSFPLR